MTKHSRNLYQREFKEIELAASKFWPVEISESEATQSTIPLLLDSQQQFIHIIGIDVSELDKLFTIIESSTLSANLFLKHLVILADFGGELLKRVSREFPTLFPERKLSYQWRGTPQTYEFQALPSKKFSNRNLQIEGKQLTTASDLDNLKKDAIALLLFGSSYSGNDHNALSMLSKCEIGEYIGKPDQLSLFMKQRYIWVSRIIGGAKANNLGQLAQQFALEYIEEKLAVLDIKIKQGGRIPSVSHTDPTTGRDTAFDLVVTDGYKYVAIEVSFQVTTNSTIERKSGQAKSRFQQIESAGHKIAYVVDGSGNFERKTALKTILAYSHCSVAFTRPELDILCQFLQEYFTA